MVSWWVVIAALVTGCTLGVFLMGWLYASGPSIDEAIRHLGELFWLIENSECDFSNGVTHGNIDEGTVMAIRALEKAERFLLSVGDNYVMSTRGLE